MEAGRLRDSITFLAPATALDDYGAPVGGYDEVFTARANYQPVIGREFYESRQMQSEVEVKFTIRYRSGVLPNYLIRHRGIDYEIVGPPIDVDGRGRELLCYCKKVT
jgi:SPP1 family predicted phage head-tail adaptor